MSLDIPRLRLTNQHIDRPIFRDAGELVAHMGAVQAQDYPGGKWGVGLRLRGATTDASIERAMARREIVRTWPMRGTLHFVSAKDVRWMLRLLTPRVARGAAARYRQLELDEGAIAKARKVIVGALEGGRVVTRLEVNRLLRDNGIETANNRSGHIYGHLAHEGTIVFGPHEGKQATFVLLEEWLPPAPVIEGEEAICELASRYFTSHGPATLADFCWWSGLTLREARSGVAAASALVEEDGYWMPRSGVRKGTGVGVWLLPPFDEYAVAYRDRSAIVPTGPARAAVSGGIFAAIVVVDGQVAGTWKRVTKPGGVEIVVSLVEGWTADVRERVAAAAERYAAFLGMPLCGVSSPDGSFVPWQ